MTRIIFVLGAVGLWACGKPSPAEECKKIVAESCKKLYQCDAAGAASLGYASEADCETKQAALLDCTSTHANCNYDSSAVDQCLSDFDKQACGTNSSPASCDLGKLCPGQLACNSEDVSLSSNGCTVTFSGCTDHHTYGANCPQGSTTCTCQVDGANVAMMFTAGDLCGSANAQSQLKTGCSFGFP